jgi:putative aldouronate transport system substrate-binding protein
MKRFLALTLAVLMAMALLTGCGGSDKPAAGSDQPAENLPLKELSLPLCEEKQELTVWLAYSGTVMKDLNEIESVKKMEELTNVHINWVPVNQDDMVQKFGTLIASGDLPDIIQPNYYPGGYEAGVEDGIIHPNMDYYIRNYMPNYMALLNSNEQLKREATADSGKMIVAKVIVGQANTVESEGTYMGLAYRADLWRSSGWTCPPPLTSGTTCLSLPRTPASSIPLFWIRTAAPRSPAPGASAPRAATVSSCRLKTTRSSAARRRIPGRAIWTP